MAGGTPGRRRWKESLLFWSPVAYLLLARLHPWGGSARPGLEGSWHLGLNLLVGSPLRFGRDVVFSYGPLGYWLVPLPVGRNLVHAALFWSAIHLLVIGLAVLFRRRTRSNLAFWLFALSFSAAASLGLTGEYYLLLPLSLLILAAWREPKARFAFSAAAGFLSAVFLFMKLSLGMAAVLLIAAAGAVALVRRRGAAVPVLLSGAVAWVLTFTALAASLFGSMEALARWWQASRELAGDYTVAMSTVGPPEFLVAGVLALVVFERLLERQRSSNRDLTAMSAVGLVLAFKHGFGRQDQHVVAFFAFLLGLISLSILVAESRSVRRAACLAFFLVAVLCLPAFVRYDPWTLRAFPREFSGIGGGARLLQLAHFRQVESVLRERGERSLRENRAEGPVAERLTSGASTAVLPWEVSLVAAHGLSWRPAPVFQSHMAYTEALDGMNAEFFRGPRAPFHLLVEFTEIDGRNPRLATPATWRSVLDSYQYAEGPDPRGRVLLERRAGPSFVRRRETASETARVGAWIDVPPRDPVDEVKVGMELNPAGRLARLFFRVPPLWITLETQSGAVQYYRFLAGTAPAGIPVDRVTAGVQDLLDLLAGLPGDRVRRFRIEGDGAFYYRPVIRVTWMETAAGDGVPGRVP